MSLSSLCCLLRLTDFTSKHTAKGCRPCSVDLISGAIQLLVRTLMLNGRALLRVSSGLMSNLLVLIVRTMVRMMVMVLLPTLDFRLLLELLAKLGFSNFLNVIPRRGVKGYQPYFNMSSGLGVIDFSRSCLYCAVIVLEEPLPPFCWLVALLLERPMSLSMLSY